MLHRITLQSFQPSQLLQIADFFGEYHGTSLLYSGGSLDSARHSFLGLFPYQSITVNNQQLIVEEGDQREFFCENPWEGLQQHFFSSLSLEPHAIAFGWFGYGMTRYVDPSLSLPHRSNSLPDAYWQHCAITISVDHFLCEASIQIRSCALNRLQKDARAWITRLSSQEEWAFFLNELSFSSLNSQQTSQNLLFDDQDKKIDYINKVIQAQDLIRQGEIYQVNLSQEFILSHALSPFSLFRKLEEYNPAPFSAYFRWNEISIVCTSPERFLSKKGQRLETRPIKGTIQRGVSSEEDKELKERLLTSPKERAELLMITDLMRNDLGKVSQTGSVIVEELWRCEAYTNVFHLVSVISSIAKKCLSPLEIVRSCFPGGSITGCPKLRSIEVIDQFEKRSRGIYTGSIGYFTGKGDFDLNIAIRTLVMNESSCTLQLGSGIVYDSNPEQEYQETLFKGESFFQLLQSGFSRGGSANEE